MLIKLFQFTEDLYKLYSIGCHSYTFVFLLIWENTSLGRDGEETDVSGESGCDMSFFLFVLYFVF